jgi:hypothetical protein
VTGFTPGFVDPAMEAADIEWLAAYYLTPLMDPSIPIATRLPQPDKQADTINGFLRLEAGGGPKVNFTEYNLTTILHAYSPNEIQASQISRAATGWMAAARGQTIAGWGVTDVPTVIGSHKLGDPNVAGLTRYRSLVTWRVPGRLMVPGVIPGS